MQTSHRPLMRAVLLRCASPVPLLHRHSYCYGSPGKSDFSCLSFYFHQNNCSGKFPHKFREQHLCGRNTELNVLRVLEVFVITDYILCRCCTSVHANTATIKKHSLISFVLLQKSSPATHAIQLNPADISSTFFSSKLPFYCC